MKPSEYPPPFDPAEVFVPPSDPPDERIDVGILVVGGGPAGLAAAIRAGQLLQERPELAERLGDVPICVLEKGRAPGSHALSGAVVNPRGMQLLFPGMRASEMPFAGLVEHEAVYFLSEKRALRVPMPPQMRNDRNYFASVSRLCRWLAERAEELGVTIVPETSAVKLLETGGRVVGVRTGDQGRGRDGEELANTEPGSDVTGRVTILAEGTLGHLSRAAIEHYDLADAPQVYALGVKEVWEVAEPLVPIIHTIGWPLRLGKRWREFGGSFIYPMGENLVSLGLVVGLDYTDPALSVHDLLQQLKTHPLVSKILEGGKRIAWGAKTIPEGGFQALPERLNFPGGLIVGDAAGFVNVPALKGIHYAMDSGRLAAEAALGAVAPGSTAWTPGALSSYDEAVRSSFIWSDLRRERNLRPAFAKGFVAGSGARGHGDDHVRQGAPRRPGRSRRMPSAELASRARAPTRSRTGRSRSTSSRASSRRERTRATTRRTTSGSGATSRGVSRETWVNMCPAQVYAIAGEAEGDLVSVEVTASNCVQCGAITAKGGRLTIPEGGDGPEYTVM